MMTMTEKFAAVLNAPRTENDDAVRMENEFTTGDFKNAGVTFNHQLKWYVDKGYVKVTRSETYTMRHALDKDGNPAQGKRNYYQFVGEGN